MKKYIFKMPFVILATAFAICAVSCTEETLPENLVPGDTSDIIMPAAGGEGTIDYAIENFSSSGAVKAFSSEEWISSLYCGEYGKVSFIAERNQTGNEREALITVEYAVSSQSFQVKVIQEGASGAPRLVLVSPETIQVSVPGGKYEIEYQLFGTGTDKDKLTVSYGADWISAYKVEDNIISVFFDPNISVEKRTAEITVGYPDLESVSVIAEQVALSSDRLDISIRETGTHYVQVSVEPTSAQMDYILMVDTREHIDALAGDYELFQEDLAFFQQYATAYGISIEEVMRMYMKQGDWSGVFEDLEADTEYCCYGYGVNENAEYQTLVFMKDFKTEAIPYSDCTFSITPVAGFNYATVNVEPSDEAVRYIVGIIDPDSYFLAYGQFNNASMQLLVDDIIEAMSKDGLTTEEIVEKITYTGKQSLYFSGLEPSTENMVYCVGLSDDADIITDAHSVVFRTADDPSIMPLTYSFDITALDSRSVSATVVPSDGESYFCWGITGASSAQEDVVAKMREEAQVYIDLGVVNDFEEYVEAYLKNKGTKSRTFDNLAPGTDYKLYAIQISRTGEFTQKMQFSEVFATPEATVSTCSITIAYDDFWDGAELAALYPDFAQFSQYAVLPVSVVTEGDVASFKYAFLAGEWADPSLHSDDDVIQYLNNYGFSFKTNTFFVTWDYQFAIVAVAMDSSGNYSEVFRASDKLTKADAADPSDYEF